jgi:ATP-dependent Lhr-like helicase
MKDLPSRFGAATRAWLEAHFAAPTPVQARGWPLLAAGAHALLVAPTGSGKTLAAFLESIDRLGRRAEDETSGVRVLYVSPLKALVYDIERNLRAPLAGIARAAGSMADDPSGARAPVFRPPRVAIRTGDSTAKERRQQGRDPAEILVTTPESLYLILGSQQRETLRQVETIIVDEIHALAPTKRGVHLSLSLERIARRCVGGDPQRIGLSATARPAEEIARFLGGDRPVEIVDTSRPPAIDLRIEVPVPDMTRPEQGGRRDPDDPSRPDRATGDGEAETSLWPAIHPELLERIRAHRSSIIFTNSRGLCERLAHRLNELAGEDLVRAHHGSLAHEKRRDIEQALAAGELRAIVATSSLELGIDMAAVELVMLIESPGSVARGLQRIGRAGHAVGETSRGVLFPKHRGDLLEAAVVATGMRRGEVEAIRVPRHCLDVLAQQIVAIAAEAPIEVAALEAMLARTLAYRDLPPGSLRGVLDMLSGRYPSTDFAELRPRLHWDREAERLEVREGAARVALLSGGTIPDRGQYAVHLGPDGPRIGELDEEMVHETKPGDVVTLGASSWRTLEITRDRVVVAPAPGEPGRLPFWRGDGPGRPIELGRALGRFLRELVACEDEDERRAWLAVEHGLDGNAATNLLDHVERQLESSGACPTDGRVLIERFRDELGDWRVCVLSPFGSRIHAPWALAISGRLAERGDFDARPLWTDDGIMFRFADADRPPKRELFLPGPEEVEDLVVEQLGQSALFAAQFRENAARALLLPRWRPGARTPLWVQRLRAQNLQSVARAHPDFPIMLETYRACMQDVFDMPGLVDLLTGIRARTIRVDDVETRSPSPFARSLVFAYTAAYLYQLDMPEAERRSQALSLDREMLRELLGEEALRDLLEPDVIDAIEARLQGLDPELRARHDDALHDTLRRVGDLDDDGLRARFQGDDATLEATCGRLASARRVAPIELAGRSAWIAAEDAALYRDALGASLPPGLPAAFLEPAEAPLEQLLGRHARTHGPFTTESVAARFALRPAQLEPVLAAMAAAGRLVAGEFDPRHSGREWCDREVLRRIRRATIERLRDDIAPVPPEVLCRFLLEWHGIGQGRRGESHLDEAIDLLEGLPLSFAELERSILPARVARFDPSMLDERGALGRLVWIGCRPLGERDGRVALYRRDRIATLLERPEPPDDLDGTARAILDFLAEKGASFFTEIAQHAGPEASPAPFDALWDLVWRGLVTNDTFAPLRALASRPRPGRRRGRRAPPPATAGRWSLVTSLLRDAPSATQRLHARTLLFLDRHGIVSREALAIEAQAGGFAAIYPVLRELEDRGRIRRGHFALGMTSAQLAVPGAVDRLRALRGGEAEPRAVLLAATDPAQPYGALLAWPDPPRGTGRPRRAVGAAVVLVDGAPVLFVDGGGRRLLAFVDTSREEEAARLVAALRRLARDFPRLGLRRLAVEEIDGEPVRTSAAAGRFVEAGYRAGYRGFEVERPSGGGSAALEDDPLGAHEEGGRDGDDREEGAGRERDREGRL